MFTHPALCFVSHFLTPVWKRETSVPLDPIAWDLMAAAIQRQDINRWVAAQGISTSRKKG
jgi:hypothetical protein